MILLSAGSEADLQAGAFERVKTDLLKRGRSCPGTVKALMRTMNNLFENKLSDGELACLLNELQSTRSVSVSGTKVTYALSATTAEVVAESRAG